MEEEVPERDTRKGKAKMEEEEEEEADQEFPEPVSESNTVDRCFVLKIEGPIRSEDAVGPDSLENVTRTEFLVRYKDIPSLLGEEDERLKTIHKASKATIVLISYPEVRVHSQAILELWGTADEIKIAELLILDAITEMYEEKFAPTILMPPRICHNEILIPVLKANQLLGFNGENIMKLEAKSGAWVEVNPIELPSPGEPWMRRINVFGTHRQIGYTMALIDKILCSRTARPEIETYVPSEDENKQEKERGDGKEVEDAKSDKLGKSDEMQGLAAGHKEHFEEVISSPNPKAISI